VARWSTDLARDAVWPEVDRLARRGFEAATGPLSGAATAPDCEILTWANDHNPYRMCYVRFVGSHKVYDRIDVARV